jgi:hypothetical protein
MRVSPRTVVLAVVVLALGAALIYRNFPSTPTKPTASHTVRKTRSTPRPAAADVEEPSRDVEESPETPPAPLAPSVLAAEAGGEAPAAVDIPDLTGQLPPEKVSTEPDPRQIGGFRGEIFMRLDGNGDLRLDRLEIPEFCREQMMACDANNDGKIDFGEFTAAIPKLPLPAASRVTIAASALVNPPEPGQEIPTYEPQIQRRAGDAPLWFLQLDKSKDGHIAIYEWPPGRLMEFRALDLNNDGFITLEEAKKAEAMKNAPKTEPATANR